MVPGGNQSSQGLEYFCNADDEFRWLRNTDLIELARREVVQPGLVISDEIVDVAQRRASHQNGGLAAQHCLFQVVHAADRNLLIIGSALIRAAEGCLQHSPHCQREHCDDATLFLTVCPQKSHKR